MRGDLNSLIIGVDFDNTIVGYDDLLFNVAMERGLIRQDVSRSKRAIRDSIRLLPEGESKWQQLQALIYGPRMEEAKLIDGIRKFLALSTQYGAQVYVVSHKTEYATFDQTGTNIRQAALQWMAHHRLFDNKRFGLAPESVYFEDTRQGKIRRIVDLGCTCFIDDLEEIFLEESFPSNVERILYTPDIEAAPFPGVRVANSWSAINEYLFDGRA